MSNLQDSYVYYRIGDDGEWEQFRTTEWPPYGAARQTMELIADALERTKLLPEDEREAEFERVLAVVEKL